MSRRSDRREAERAAERAATADRKAERARKFDADVREITTASPEVLLLRAAELVVKGREGTFFSEQTAHFQEATALASIAMAKELASDPTAGLPGGAA